MKYTVRNWAEYDAALRCRGSLTLWVTAEAMDHWAAQPRSTPGGQCLYSDLAIETSLMLRPLFGQPLRQTEGLMASIFAWLGLDLKVPDHSTVSRRAMSLKSISKRCALPTRPARILIDNTGLKVFGAGEWLQEKHGAKSWRSWRKLHLAVDASTGLEGGLRLRHTRAGGDHDEVVTRPSLARVCGHATGGASVWKRASRWPCSTAW
jgi:hypothetical protein